MTPQESEDILKMVEDIASKLAEHVDSVRIFVTKTGDGSTSNSGAITTGRGNLYAQLGQVKEWILTQDEYVKENARRDTFEEGDEDQKNHALNPNRDI